MGKEISSNAILLTVCIGALFGVAAYMQWNAALDGDKLLGMHIAHQMLAGQRLYLDIFEANLPMLFALYAIPATLAAWVGMQDGHMLIVLVFLLFFYCLHIIQKLLRYHSALTPSMLIANGFLLAIVFVIWANTKYFGSREYLFQLCVFPYVLRYMPSLRGVALPRNISIAIGILAAIGFAQKPYCLVLLLAVQLLVAAEYRGRILFSTENKIIFALSGAYYAAILIFMPEYAAHVVPIALATYSAYSVPSLSLYLASAFYCLITFVHFRARYTSPYRADILYFVCLLAGYAIYILLNNGWAYTFYPFDSMVLYLTGWVWMEFKYLEKHYAQTGEPVQQFVEGARACAANIAFHIFCLFSFSALFLSAQNDEVAGNKLNAELASAIETAHAKSFGAISSVFDSWASVAKVTGAKQELRFHVLWMLPKFVISDETFRTGHEWILHFVADAYAADLDGNKPEVVFVDNGPEFFRTRKKLDLIVLFSVYPAFASAWKPYALTKTIDHCEDAEVKKLKYRPGCRYDVYERNRAP